jgi:hypothetical protein
MDIDEQVWLFDVGVSNGLLNPVLLPTDPQPIAPGAWNAWTLLVDLFALHKELPGGEPSLIELLELLDSDGDVTMAEDNFRCELAARTGWLREDIDTLVAAFGLRFPQDWRDGQALSRLVDAFALIRLAGVSTAQADTWAVAEIDMGQAEALRLAAKAKHDEAQWPAIARGLRDPVRDKQRAALVAYLIAKLAKYSDEDDLYSDLLIDVEMDPCMLTSRIKQAISSVQLFVQRAFLNLEDGVEFTRTDRDQWEWMKSYRVWEANRKIFLYPENWIEPELRSSKSELFEELENTLLQEEITDDSVEKAYTEYLEGLLKIARLEVMGMYHQFEEDEDGTVDILHVVARTKGNPYEYYYRQWIDGREWTPWEKLDADIEADHVILAVYDRRLYVFWPVVLQKAEGDAESTTDFFEMRLAWIERQNAQWGARRQSAEFATLDTKWEWVDSKTYFRLGSDPGLVIEWRENPYDTKEDLRGKFLIDGCTGGVTVDNEMILGFEVVRPSGYETERMRFLDEVTSTHPVVSFIVNSNTSELELLAKVQGNGSYLYPHQYGNFTSQYGVFFDDDERTFYVMPEPAFDWGECLDDKYKDNIDPANVGVTLSGYDVFTPEPVLPKFEPELPWDTDPREQALPNPSEKPKNVSKSAPQMIGAETEVTLQSLSALQLQFSQNQLNEVDTFSDALIAETTTQYRFSPFYHPYVCDFLKELRRLGVSGLLDPNPDGPAADLVRQQRHRLEFFARTYKPDTTNVLEPYPIQDIDFEYGGAYADYNWEIFFHAPFLIANRLSQNQRFEEACNWYHFMFDPTNRSDDKDPLRFWKIKPFYREADAPISEFLELAASPADSPEAEEARQQYDEQIEAWLENPFDPHAIAQLRTTAYQKTLVMKYLDNLIAWGDQLFRQDTIESINEATQLYVLALDLLGDRPDALPPRSVPVVKTFEQVRADLQDSALNNPLVHLENVVFMPTAPSKSLSGTMPLPLDFNNLVFNVSLQDPSFYFCIPPNDKLLGYWDIVEDRLFKIRHCMNIEGMVRQLPLFEPPIEPGLLVRARAAGVDLASALADLNAPLPHYRFRVILEKAYALNQTVRNLGSALLSALEKKDGEELAALRANQEVALFEAILDVKKLAVDEAQRSREAAEYSLELVQQRQGYYQRLIDTDRIPEEKSQITQLQLSSIFTGLGSGLQALAAPLTAIPRIETGNVGVQPVFRIDPVDGAKLARAVGFAGAASITAGSILATQASLAGIKASFERRLDEWENQKEMADREFKQVEKQIEAARNREDMAKRDLENHERQIDQAREVRDFMESKFTHSELYQWMVGQLSSLYFQSYQLTYDLAKQAEQAYRHELALSDAAFIHFGYWDSLKKGLLAGERLQLDLERMDKSYLENNRREYEITKHVSLALFDPVALLKLQTEGECQFSIPEALFDLEYPGHYLRRIKSMEVSVPCVTGPYTSVPARLTLVSSRTRVDPNASGEYAFNPNIEDSRFQLHTGAVQSIIVSSGREDSGLFVTDHRDERYLPFEGTGAISDWNLKLTSAVPTFDWSTITDVVLHLRYTAREGGDLLRDAALKSLTIGLAGIPLRRAFSSKHEFPTEWSAFLRPAQGMNEAVLRLDLSEKRFPYFVGNLGLKISEIQLVALVKDADAWSDMDVQVTAGNNQGALTLKSVDDVYDGNPSGTLAYQGADPGTWTIAVPTASLGAPSGWIDDAIVICTYEITVPA